MTPGADVVTGLRPRVAETINLALHSLLAADDRLYFLGEDILDPYGGAFKVARGLSTSYPDRVLTTPLSESGMVGVAGGLALCGDRVIVEIMFGDFLALAFDQVLNFATKSVSMYGTRLPMHLVIRCPVGGQRGYGPTHSQSLQKHLIGIPNLALYEMSAFHDAGALLGAALRRGTPAVVFEDKVLYGQRVYRDGAVSQSMRFEMIGGRLGWAVVSPAGNARHVGRGPDLVMIAPGGLADRAIIAAERLRAERGIEVDTLVPAQLYPLDLDPVLPLLESAGRVGVVEESTAGGTWGAEVASLLYDRIWPALRQPVTLISSADSVIPTASHLERAVLVSSDLIHARVLAAVANSAAKEHTRASGPPRADGVPVVGAEYCVVTPKLNNNDDRYLLTEWLCDEGKWVEADTPLLTIETSKALEEIAAPAAGYLSRVVSVGQECAPGEPLGYLLPQPGRHRDGGQAPADGVADDALDRTRDEVPAATGLHRLSRLQRGTAMQVTKSHREVPAAFTVVRVDADDALEYLAELSDSTGALTGLVEALVSLVAVVHERFPLMYGSLADSETVRLDEAPHVGVTMDAGNGLFVPVIRDARRLPLAELADELAGFRLKAVRGDFTALELDGGNITVSVNNAEGVLFAHPIVLWPQVCMVSMGGIQRELRLAASGNPVERRITHLGLAYDHRVVNGRDAMLFLGHLRSTLEDRSLLAAALPLGDARLLVQSRGGVPGRYCPCLSALGTLSFAYRPAIAEDKAGEDKGSRLEMIANSSR
jgi:pyruvate/2-oxoglutarate/acetoin dehydrogenase E1 component/pyruvate/2-oxoglutarate dehydrogenase complex dihydrolipoamide acyltransferase (E2) component